MELSTYKRIRNGVAAGMGILTAIGAVINNFLMPLVGISTGMIVIYLTKQKVSEIEVDERIILISQKASTATLALSIVAMSFTGLFLIFLSKGGYANYEQIGYTLNFLGLITMGLRSFFYWHYRNKYGG